jgi:hypothetical protein
MFAFSFFTLSLVDDTMVQQAVRKGQPAPRQETAGTADEVTQQGGDASAGDEVHVVAVVPGGDGGGKVVEEPTNGFPLRRIAHAKLSEGRNSSTSRLSFTSNQCGQRCSAAKQNYVEAPYSRCITVAEYMHSERIVDQVCRQGEERANKRA